MATAESGSPPTTAGIGSLSELADTNPFETFDRLREAGGVVWDESLRAWLVTRYDLLRDLTRRDDVDFRITEPDQTSSQFGMTPDEWDYFVGLGSTKELSLLLGEEHDRSHRWWLALFAPDKLAVIKEKILIPNAHAQVEGFIDRGSAELYDDYASQVPPRNMAAVLGLPYEDDGWISEMRAAEDARRAVRQRFSEQNVGRDVIDRALAVSRQMYELLLPHVLERKDGKGDDVISQVWRDARIVFGDQYDEQDVVGTAAHMWEAGTGTSGSATASALYWLLPSPELQDKVRAGGGNSVMRVVEESLRLAGPVSFRPPRFAVHDTEVGGVPIKKGDRVISLIGAANRDPQKYACPHDIDLGRRAPRDHFAFWAGRRICAGQGLGRATAEANVAVLLERVRDLRPDPGAQSPSYQGQMLRAWKPLHALFRSA